MTFVNRLFAVSFVASLWIAFLGWRPWSAMLPAIIFFAVAMLVTGMWSIGAQVVEIMEDSDVEL